MKKILVYDVEPLIHERIKRGWTRTKLAQIAGVHHSEVSRMERGEAQSRRVILRCASKLDVVPKLIPTEGLRELTEKLRRM